MTYPPPYRGVFRLLLSYSFMTTVTETVAWLDERASRYGGTAADILDKTPTSLWDNPDELRAFWDTHDLSHVFPQSLYPTLADDWTNIVPESPFPNRGRGAEIMTHGELMTAEIQSELAAMEIDDIMHGDDPEWASELIDVVFA